MDRDRVRARGEVGRDRRLADPGLADNHEGAAAVGRKPCRELGDEPIAADEAARVVGDVEAAKSSGRWPATAARGWARPVSSPDKRAQEALEGDARSRR